MDYLDPRKQFQHRIILLVGYVCVAVAIVIATLILLYQAYGFGLGKNGTVIQNGLVFLSSQPNPAKIYLDNKLYSTQTNARLVLPAGNYNVRLSRTGYRDWRRTIDLLGGSVEHFDYPVLFPINLTTTQIHDYASVPGLATQSPDRRWLLVQQPGSMTAFDLYDLKNDTKTVMTTISLPTAIVSKATNSESWQVVAWADDNQHVLLQHIYDGKSEFILLDTQNPDQSLNLNTTLATSATNITLDNIKYNQYYLYDALSDSLEMASLKSPTATPYLDHVLAYQSYGNNSMLYVTDSDAPAGKTLLKLAVGSQTYILHSFPVASNYVLDLTQYAGTLYVAAGASSENKVYIYRDPIAQLQAQPSHAVTPVQVLHVTDPDYLSFSDNAQFIVTEHGMEFGTYDIENKLGYKYTINTPLDPPEAHATWMDGDRLTLVSGGKLVVFDYDDANQQTLMPGSAAYLPFFSTDYKYVYAIAPDSKTPGQFAVTQTSLLTAADR